MNQYLTGETIKKFREKHKLTQLELANKIGVSDKAVSKWETGRGYPDIALLQPIAESFSVSIAELLAGKEIKNTNTAGNMIKTKLYVCPVCGNVIHSVGEITTSCHGIDLPILEPEENDENHIILVERIENDYFIHIDHEMTKQHYISFVMAVSSDDIQLKKLYPESVAEVRFPMRGLKKLYFYCNKDGLFCHDIIPSSDGKSNSYDDTK